MKRYVIGIDAGGTGIRAVAAEVGSGNIAMEGEAPSDPDGGPAPLLSLLESFRQSVDPGGIVAVRAGITKVSRKGVKDAWDAFLLDNFPHASVECVPDFVIAFHSSLSDGIGIVSLAGTGSVIYGENGRGKAARVGGRGWEFGDEGSGAWLTTALVRRTLRTLDVLERASPLTAAVCEVLHTNDPAALGEAARRSAEDSGRGFLAPLALDFARAGDREAKNLYVGAAAWLAVQVRSAAAQLEFAEDLAVAVSMMGGLWSAGAILSDPFESVVRRYLPNAHFVKPQGAPVLGAVRMALRSVES